MQLLAGTLYDPGTAVAKATSSRLAMTAFDTTNLRLAFTTPVNCTAVFVRIRTNLSGATTMPQVLLGVLDGSTVKGRQVAQGSLPGTAIATTNVSLWAEFLITGLSGNTAYTYDAAYGVETEVASTNIHYGGPNNTTANDAWGGFVFEIWDPAPAPANFDVFSIDTNGRIDVIKVAGTTQTARDLGASVLLSPGTGAGQLDISSGKLAWNSAWDAEVQSEVDDGLIAQGLDHLVNASVAGTDIVDNSIIAKIVSKSATADWDSFANTTDALEAIRDKETDIETDTQDIQNRLPAALVGGRMDSNMGAISTDATAADNLETMLDGTGGQVLSLKQLNVVNSSGNAIVAQSGGGDGHGIKVVGNGVGNGIDVAAGVNGDGVYITAGASDGTGLNILSPASDGVLVRSQGDSSSRGVAVVSANGSGLYIEGGVTGAEIYGITDAGAYIYGVDAGIDIGIGKSINAPNDIAVSDGDLTLAAIAAAVWANATRTLTSFGTLIADAVDAIWDEATSGHTTAGTTGKALIDAGAAGDPWGTSLPGSYGAGTAGKIVGDNINATISSRSSHSAADVWAVGTRTLTGFGTLVSDIWAAVVDSAGVTTLLSRLTNTRAGNLDNLDAAISSRLAAVSYTAPDNAGIAAIQAKTDQLTFTVANQLDSNVQYVNDTQLTGDGSSGNPWGPA